MTDDREMQVHPSQRLTAPDGIQVNIDDDMVALILALWSLNLETTACCQDFGEGTAGQRAASPHRSRYGGGHIHRLLHGLRLAQNARSRRETSSRLATRNRIPQQSDPAVDTWLMADACANDIQRARRHCSRPTARRSAFPGSRFSAHVRSGERCGIAAPAPLKQLLASRSSAPCPEV